MSEERLIRSIPWKRVVIALALFLLASLGILIPTELDKEAGESVFPDSIGVTGFAILGGQVGSGTSVFPNPLSPISVTNNSTIVPSTFIKPLISTEEVKGLKVVDGAKPGEFLVFINDNDVDHIVIDGTGDNVRCGRDIDLGPGDTLMIAWDESHWFCVSYYDKP